MCHRLSPRHPTAQVLQASIDGTFPRTEPHSSEQPICSRLSVAWAHTFPCCNNRSKPQALAAAQHHSGFCCSCSDLWLKIIAPLKVSCVSDSFSSDATAP